MYSTFHSIQDQAKYQALVAAMQTDGWQGAPLVADGDQLITGAHRYPAALAAGIEPQVVDIRDILPSWDTLHAEYGAPTSDEREYVMALQEIPFALRVEYGIDVE